jgi:hypothetical protein
MWKAVSAMNQSSGRVVAALAVGLSVGLAGCSDDSDDVLQLFCPAEGAVITSTAITVDVEVDFSQPEPAPILTGVLHGVTDQTPFHAIADIKLASARVNANSYFGDVFAVHGITPVFVVSGAVNLQGASPAADWDAFEAQVRAVATEYGNSVIYDIWNEPDQPFFWPFWAGMSAEEGNTQLLEFLEAFKRAHDVIRDVLGDAVVISGPSFGGIDEGLLRRFMDYSRQQQLTVQVLSVHLIYNPDNTFGAVEQRLGALYEEYVEGPGYDAVGVVELHVNEYGAPKQYGRPGSMLALLRVMERGGVAQAMRAIWGPSAAFVDDLNGYLFFAGIAEPLFPVTLSLTDGKLTDLLDENFDTRPLWWAYKLYADGAESRVAASSNLDYIMPLASSASAALGYNQLLLAAYDSDSFPDRPDRVGVRLDNLPVDGSATIRVFEIPYDDAIAQDEPVAIYECALRLQSAGQLTFSVEMPGDYEVLALTVGR